MPIPSISISSKPDSPGSRNPYSLRSTVPSEATSMVVNGFIEPITKEIPLEYAIELNRLIEPQMEGSIG